MVSNIICNVMLDAMFLVQKYNQEREREREKEKESNGLYIGRTAESASATDVASFIVILLKSIYIYIYKKYINKYMH